MSFVGWSSRVVVLFWISLLFAISLVFAGCSAVSARVDAPGTALDGGRCPGDADSPTASSSDADAPPAAAKAAFADDPDSPPQEEEHAEDETVEDEPEESQIAEPGQRRPHPFDSWTIEQFVQTVLSEPKYLGSVSIGRSNRGALLNGIQLAPGDGWTLLKPSHAWGTQETIEGLTRCIERVRMQFPGTSPIYIGHLSGPNGGPLSPHRSHQSGRDVDIGYYYTNTDTPWYTRATADNLDRPRTWALIRCLIVETDLEYLFIDRSVQKLLRSYAYRIGEPKAWIDGLFDGGPSLRPIILHAKGHATHIHIRFYSPVSQETGRRIFNLLVERRVLNADGVYTPYVLRRGDTFAKIAKQFGTSIKAIQELNRLKATMDRAALAYRPARRGAQPPPSAVLLFPPRRLPPNGAGPSSATSTLTATAGSTPGP